MTLHFRKKEATERSSGGAGWGWGVEEDEGGSTSSHLTSSQMREQQQRLLQGEGFIQCLLDKLGFQEIQKMRVDVEAYILE